MHTNPWRLLESILSEDTAGNLSRILGLSLPWSQRFVQEFGKFAFTAAKYVVFVAKSQGPGGLLSRALKEESPADGWERMLRTHRLVANDFEEGRTFISIPDMIRILEKKPAIASKLNGSKTLEEFTKILEQAAKDHAAREGGVVFMRFEDGYTWVDLGIGCSEVEGELMQHCGLAGAGGTLFSLRDPGGKPHVTIEYDKEDNKIAQVAGKQNTRPSPKYVPYIQAFVKKTGADVAYGSGWDDSWD